MQTVLIVFHLLVVIARVASVLLQRSEGGALGVGGGGGFMTGRGQANALTRATAILATLFFLTSMTLTLLANLHRTPTSIFDTATPASANHTTVPNAPAAPGTTVLDQLKQLQDQKSGAAPAALPAPAGPEAPKSQ
jgi:preprotein translocase subunit SecG